MKVAGFPILVPVTPVVEGRTKTRTRPTKRTRKTRTGRVD